MMAWDSASSSNAGSFIHSMTSSRIDRATHAAREERRASGHAPLIRSIDRTAPSTERRWSSTHRCPQKCPQDFRTRLNSMWWRVCRSSRCSDRASACEQGSTQMPSAARKQAHTRTASTTHTRRPPPFLPSLRTALVFPSTTGSERPIGRMRKGKLCPAACTNGWRLLAVGGGWRACPLPHHFFVPARTAMALVHDGMESLGCPLDQPPRRLGWGGCEQGSACGLCWLQRGLSASRRQVDGSASATTA